MMKKTISIILSGIILCSCTSVSYDAPADPEGSSLTFKLDFSQTETKPSEIPANMEVFMSELLNGHHYRFYNDSGFVIKKEGEFPIKGGDYSIVAIGGDSTDYEMVGDESFLDSLNPSSLDKVRIKLDILSDQEVVERYCHGLNYMASPYFAVPPVPVLYLASQNNVPIYFDESGKQCEVPLTLAEMGMTLTFSVNIQIENGVVVDSVFAGISGVPIQMNLLEGTVRRDSLGKSFFRMTSASSGSGVYTGKVRTFGLFSSDKESEKNGSGIFWISATVSSEDKSVVLGSGINLKSMIDSYKIMMTDDRIKWKPMVKEASFAIDKTYYISKEMVSSRGKDQVDEWIRIGDAKDSIIVEL